MVCPFFLFYQLSFRNFGYQVRHFIVFLLLGFSPPTKEILIGWFGITVMRMIKRSNFAFCFEYSRKLLAYSVFLLSIPVEMQLPVGISALFEVFYIQILRKDTKHFPFIGQNQAINYYNWAANVSRPLQSLSFWSASISPCEIAMLDSGNGFGWQMNSFHEAHWNKFSNSIDER